MKQDLFVIEESISHTGTLLNYIKSTSRECSMTIWIFTMYSVFPTDQTLYQPWYLPWPLPNYGRFRWSICDGCGMPTGNAYSSSHLVSSEMVMWSLRQDHKAKARKLRVMFEVRKINDKFRKRIGLVPSHFGTCICSNVETIFTWACHLFGLWISNIPRYFYFAQQLGHM